MSAESFEAMTKQKIAQKLCRR